MTVLRIVWVCILGLTLVAATTINCPQMCNCQHLNDTKLTVDGGGVYTDEGIFSHELNVFLSDEKLREHLTLLQINKSPLTEIPLSVCQLSNLTSLNLDHNRLIRLPDSCFSNLTSLQWLSASYNFITELRDGIFDGLNSLIDINLSSNRIASIGLRVFSNPNDLVNLRQITLDNNRLQSLEPWPAVRGLHGRSLSRILINVRNNLISKFTNNIGWQWDCSRRSYARLFLTENPIRHLNDFIVGWNVTPLARILCSLHRFRIYVSGSTDYYCDCHDIAFYTFENIFADKNFLQDLRCSKPQRLFGKFALQIPLEEFTCDLYDRCPSSCRSVYRPGNATLHVYCSDANLSSLPLDLPPLPRSYDMYKLDFSNNKLLRRLEHRPYFSNTTIIDVSDCSISKIDLTVWQELAKLKSFATSTPRVYLHKNNIRSLPAEITGVNFTSVRLTLYDNLWECSCRNRWMITWLKSLSIAFPGGRNVICALPSRLKGRSIMQSNEADFCVNPETRMLTIFLSSTLPAITLIAVLLLSGFTVYRLRVRVYRKWKFHPFDRDECAGEDMDYDAFLSCSSLDDDPHGQRILELMEANGYRVCYHERDFLPGQLILDNMVQSIERSKRTVCLISSNFLKSSFCMTEFDMAFHHNVAEKRKKRLIVLTMLDNPTELYANDASDMATLRQYLRQYTYIDYTADDWLDRLLYALPLQGLLQHKGDSSDDMQLLH